MKEGLQVQVNSWGGLLAIVGLIRTATEVLGLPNEQQKKASVVFMSGASSVLFNWNIPSLLGLQVNAGAWTPIVTFIVNTVLLSLATFAGHDGLNQLSGRS